ncbi:MAG: DUF6259 domain-containing protein [Verrucomicrobiae bacterium]|nr:DUF6259 domain-containing protein [Verrucomicrobiae bacterium]
MTKIADLFLLMAMFFAPAAFYAAQIETSMPGCHPREYTVRRDDSAGILTLSTPYYIVQHDLKKGGAITSIHYVHGKCGNLLVRPITASLVVAGKTYSDQNNHRPVICVEKLGKNVKVAVECDLLDEKGLESGVRMKTVHQYRWGYIKIHRELYLSKDISLGKLVVFNAVLDPSLAKYGYRQGIMEQCADGVEFGGCQWGRMRAGTHLDLPLQTRHVPRYLVFANQGVEGLEWFVSDDLSQWDYQLTGRPGDGLCEIGSSMAPLGVSVSVCPVSALGSVECKKNTYSFDYYLGMPILEGHAPKPWMHATLRKFKGQWPSGDLIKQYAQSGIKTMHYHHDGNYDGDGVFWRNGAYPPYSPADMKEFDCFLNTARQNGIKMATYFSTKELHPSTAEFKKNGEEWGRKPYDSQILLHNNCDHNEEFGAQMCLKSGWADYLKFCIDRVLKNHQLEGVYYDWNAPLYCNNPLHMGKISNGVAPIKGRHTLAWSSTGHWDVDELIELMEWTRERVGANGLVFIHNTRTPMMVTENFANGVCGMEWGYGRIASMPPVEDLPLEWNFVGARPRGLIAYGFLAYQELPKNGAQISRLIRLFDLQTLLTGVTPWPATDWDQAPRLNGIFKRLGDVEKYKFEDCRNQALKVAAANIVTAVYGQAGEAYILVGNFDAEEKKALCRLDAALLPCPLSGIRIAEVIIDGKTLGLDANRLVSTGETIHLPAEGLALIHVK